METLQSTQDTRNKKGKTGVKRKWRKKNLANKKRKLSEMNELAGNTDTVDTPNVEVPAVRKSDDPIPKKVKWTNKQRVLIFASRGITHRDRHLMEDLKSLLPHSKPDNKRDKKESLQAINTVAEMKNCNKCIFFENKKRKDLYMWVSNVSKGPSVKFLVQNVHSMQELKLTGNSLKGSRPLLCFDSSFNEQPWALVKELMTQVFGAPFGHPKTQPFFDKVFVFSLVDDRIWFRNYQIVEEDGQLTEIGPRFVLNPIKVFEGSFGGLTLWSNEKFVSPNVARSKEKEYATCKYLQSTYQKRMRQARAPKAPFKGDPTNDFFETKPPEEAKGKEKNLFFRKTKAKGKKK